MTEDARQALAEIAAAVAAVPPNPPDDRYTHAERVSLAAAGAMLGLSSDHIEALRWLV